MRRFVPCFFLAVAFAACTHAPAPPRPTCSSEGELSSVCGFENPEDIAYLPSQGMLIVSNLRMNGQGGFLSVLPVDGGAPKRLWPPTNEDGKGETGMARMPALGEPGCGNIDADLFAPHGMYLDMRDPISPLLYVVNHGGREAVEIFSFGQRGEQTMLFWSACIELPAGTSGNDVAVAADHEVIVSNYMPPGSKLWSNLKSGLGLTTGDIITWNIEQRWRHLPDSAASAPNGVEISPDDKWIYYSATGGGSITRVARDGGEARHTRVEGKPDNLTWTAAGTLLLATHTSTLEFLKCLREQPCRSPWAVLEIDPEIVKVKTLVQHNGSVVGAVASALEVKHAIILSAVFGDRVGVWRPPVK